MSSMTTLPKVTEALAVLSPILARKSPSVRVREQIGTTDEAFSASFTSGWVLKSAMVTRNILMLHCRVPAQD